ncbi:MAG: Ig-like domain-containing protein, partial [Caldilineaceae bacterium]|nr:Ig-like domain-containing protein [Caldilineaceae bacterium]
MRRSVLLALTVTCLVLAGFMFFSQRYRHADVDAGTEPLLAASAMPTISPLEPPMVEASYQSAAPSIEFRQPAREMLLTNHPTIYLVFDQPMAQESVRTALTVDPPVALVTTWLGNTLYIEPVSTLKSATEYRFTLGMGAKSQASVALAAPYRWRYRSATAAHAPVLVTEPTPVIFLTFDGPVDPVDLQFDPPLRTTQRWFNTAGGAGSNQLEITPQEALWPETEYQLHFDEPLLTIHGDPVSLPPLTVHTPPPLVAHRPFDSTVENPLTPITVDFAPLYAALLNRQATAATLQITPPVTGTTTWDGSTLTFTPAAGYWVPRSLYQVAISPVLSDSRR